MHDDPLDDPEEVPNLLGPYLSEEYVPDLLGPYVPTAGERAKGAGFRLLEGLAKGFGGLVAAPGIALEAVGATNLGGQPIGRPLIKAGRWIGQRAEGLRPDKELAAEGPESEVAGAVGSVLSFIGTGGPVTAGLKALRYAPLAASRIAGIATGVGANAAGGYFEALGETGNHEQAAFAAEQARLAGASPADVRRTYDTVLEETGDEEKAFLNFLMQGALVGPFETFGVGELLPKLAGTLAAANRQSAGQVAGALAKMAVEEFSQEAYGQFVGNVGAYLIGHDKERALWEGVAKAGTLGGAAALIIGGPVEFAANAAARPPVARGEDDETVSRAAAPPELQELIDRALVETAPAPEPEPKLDEAELAEAEALIEEAMREPEAAPEEQPELEALAPEGEPREPEGAPGGLPGDLEPESQPSAAPSAAAGTEQPGAALEPGPETPMPEPEGAAPGEPEAPRPAPSGLTEIGKNAAGRTLYEDRRGVRSYIENGVRVTEPVRLGPRGEILGTRERTEEWEVIEPTEQAEAPPEPEAEPQQAPVSIPEPVAKPKRGPPLSKEDEENLERSEVRSAREVVETGRREGQTEQEVFDELLTRHLAMPKLKARTSTSRELQAFSTPTPIAWVASRLAGIERGMKVYEPTAGHGALLIDAEGTQVTLANELDPNRARSLKEQGFTVTEKDATQAWPDPRTRDVVIANPPFGHVRNDKNEPRYFDVPLTEKGKYLTREIDHAIAAKALTSMKDTGRAVLILGGKNPFGDQSQAARTRAYHGRTQQAFWRELHAGYNVVDHFTIAGKLYDRMGAAWPIDVVVIHGRKAPGMQGGSAVPPPYRDAPRVLESWDAVRALLSDARLGAPRGKPEADLGERPDEPGAQGEPEPGEVQGARGEPTSGGTRTPGRKGRQGDRGGARGEPTGTPTAPEPATGGVEPVPDDRGGQPGRDVVDDGGQPEVASEPPAEVAPEREPRAEERGREGAAREASPELQERTLELSSELQGPYRAASKGVPMGTQVPANMQAAMDRALATIQKEHGDIDTFVAGKLGYELGEMLGTVEKPGYLAAEQVDALALAITNVDLGAAFINGDQTGVGKGRFVAAMLRYGMKQGKIPVFVTKSDGLYADIMRDFEAIGMPNVRPFMTNLDLLNEKEIPLDNGGTLKSLTGKAYTEALRELTAAAKAGKQPANFDVVFTTYTQMDPHLGRTKRQAWLQTIVPEAMVLLDESHEAGGTEQSGFFMKDGEPVLKETRGDFFREVVDDAWGVVFSSATYAKNPYTLSLYSRTDMGKAVKDPKELPALIRRGGVPLQQMIATGLVEAGQYVRRERSFEGITVEPVIAETDRALAERGTEIIRTIFEWDLSLRQTRKDQASGIAGGGGGVAAGDSSKGAGGAISGGFSSIMHNLVSQTLLALKARETGRAAVEMFKEGRPEGKEGKKKRRKPIIALQNTMEAMLDDFIEARESQVGDIIEGFTFANVFEKYLNKTLQMTVSVGGGNPPVRVFLELSPEQQQRFEEIRQFIRDADLADLPASPIDAMIQEMESGGLRVGEITGRELRVKYEGDRAILTQRTNTNAAKKRTMRAYNDGELDAVILNQSGSTGYSLHASPHNGPPTTNEAILAARKTARHMMVVQPPGDINVLIQMLGRINRTGQVELPSYDILMSDLPAEKRPGAIMLKKLASLSANVSANRKSAVQPSKAVDFMNVYGDEVVMGLLRDNPELIQRLGLTGDKMERLIVKEELARGVTGFTPILPIAEQEEFLSTIEARYEKRLEEAKARGENRLEAPVEDIRAKTLSAVEVKRKEGTSPFAKAATLETVEGIRRKRLYSWDELQRKALRLADPNIGPLALDKLSEAEVQERMPQAQRKGIERMTMRLRDALKELNRIEEKKQRDLAKEIPEDAPEKHPKREALLASRQRQIRAAANAEAISGRIQMLRSRSMVLGPKDSGEHVWIVGIEEPGKKDNPLAPSSWGVILASPQWESLVSLPVSRLMKATAEKDNDADLLSEAPALDATDFPGGTKDVKEIREIVTGNILAAFEQFKGKGTLSFYTNEKGARKQGLILPRGIDPIEELKSQPVPLTGKQVVQFLDEIGGEVVEKDGDFKITGRGSSFPLELQATNTKGGKAFYLSKAAREALGGDFRSRRGEKEWIFTSDDRKKVAKALAVYERDLDARFLALKNLDEARRIAGIKIPTKAPTPPAAGGGITELHAGPPIRMPGVIPLESVKRFFRKHFRWHGAAPREAGVALEGAKHFIQAELSEIADHARRLDRAVAKAHGKGWPAKPIARVIDAAFEDPEKLADLPPAFAEPLAMMRAHTDRMSRLMIQEGAVDPQSALAEKILGNVGTYSKREYRAFNDIDHAEKVPEDVKQRFMTLLLSHGISREREAEIRERFAQAGERSIERERQRTQTIIDTAKSLRPALLPELIRNEQQKLQKRIDQIRKRQERFAARRIEKESQPRAKTEEEARHIMETILQEAKEVAANPFRQVSSAKLGRKDLSIFRRRKNVPPELRALLGEIEDPIANYANSVMRMAQIVAKHRAYTEIREVGLANGWLAEPDERVPGLVATLSREGNPALGPLDGMHTTPEIKEALSATPIETAGYLRALLMANSAIKWGKVLGQPTAASRNLLSNVTISIANGHLPLWIKGEAWKHALGKGSLEERKRLIRLGIIGEGINSYEWNDLRASLKQTPEEMVKAQRGLFEKTKEGVETIYAAADNLPKIMGFYAEEAALVKAGYGKAAAEREAADRIRDLYPTPERMAQAAKKFRGQPFLGQYFAFRAELFRTLVHRLRLIRAELKSPNPKVRSMGRARIYGQIVAAGLVPAAVATFNILNGIDADEDDDRREFIPPWDVDSEVVWFGDELEGEYLDISDIDPQSLFTDAVMRVALGEDVEEVARHWLADQGQTFFGPSPLSKLIVEAYTRKTEGGRGSPIDDLPAHVWQSVAPGVVDWFRREKEAGFGPGSVGSFLLARRHHFDVVDSLGHATRAFQRRISDTTYEMNRAEGTPSARAEAEGSRRELFTDLSDKVQAAIRLGVPPGQVFKILDERLSQAVARAVIAGQYVPLPPPERTP